MPWFKVDDGLAFHRKTVAAGNAAMGLWVRSGSWCAQQLTDGFVPDHMIAILGTGSQAARLVKVGLWIEVPGGFEFHQWSENGRQPTSESVRAERERAAQRQAEWRAKKSGKPQVDAPSNGVTPPLVTPPVTPAVTGAPTRPDPTRPVVPNGTTPEGPRKRGTRIPEDFAKTHITPDLVAWAQQRCPDIDGRTETERFVLWAESTSGAKGVKLDWVKAWKNWLLEEQKRVEQRRAPHLRVVPQPAPLPADATAAFDELRNRADAKAAALLIGAVWTDPDRKPSDPDPTPYPQWLRARRQEFLDEHRDAIRAALTARRTG